MNGRRYCRTCASIFSSTALLSIVYTPLLLLLAPPCSCCTVLVDVIGTASTSFDRTWTWSSETLFWKSKLYVYIRI